MTNNELFSLDNDALDNLLLCRGKDKISTELEEETVILDLKSEVYSGLDAVGSSVWNLLEQPKTFSTLCQEIMDEYEVQEHICRTDLLAFLKDLADKKLITVQYEATI